MVRRGTPRVDLGLMHSAARMYYLDDRSQADIAGRLNVSRPTVSRMLTEARRIGLVRITVHDPSSVTQDGTFDHLAEALGVERVWLAPFSGVELGATLAEPVADALRAAGLGAGDVLLVSSGRTLHELSRTRLPMVSGVEIVPTVGGVSEPEAWHQTNEITRAFAERMQGRPHFLFAQAMPSEALHRTLLEDPDFRTLTGMWDRARVAVVGIGAPPATRESISRSVPLDDAGLRAAAGDVCLHFFAADGGEVAFPGSDRMVRIGRDQLRAVPTVIAAARGEEKVPSIVAAARAGLFTQLVTDAPTAAGLLAALPS